MLSSASRTPTTVQSPLGVPRTKQGPTHVIPGATRRWAVRAMLFAVVTSSTDSPRWP
jgi:hypothetical protein